MSKADDEAAAFYADPAHLETSGPPVKRSRTSAERKVADAIILERAAKVIYRVGFDEYSKLNTYDYLAVLAARLRHEAEVEWGVSDGGH